MDAWRDIISLLPTKQDIAESAASIVSTLSRKIHDLKQRINTVASWVTTFETSSVALESRMVVLEESQTNYQHRLIMLQLSVDDGENCSCRNNIRLHGLPEATSGGDLRATVMAIFNRLLDKPPTAELKLHLVHRVQGPGGGAHFLREMFCPGSIFIHFDGAAVHLFPNLSRLTLGMRGVLRPLLKAIRNAGAAYRWGHPFQLAVLKGNGSFILRWLDQLPDLFAFLEIPEVPIPDWLDFPITFGNTRPTSLRPQRSTR